MKTILSTCLALAAVALPLAAQDEGFASDKERLSYALGLNIASGMKGQQIDVDLDVLFQGFRDAWEGNAARLGDEEVASLLNNLQNEIMGRQQQRAKALAEENKAAANSFLDENKARVGVVTLDSGLQYEVLQAGDGPSPAATDQVTVHYTGMLLDGTKFDSSVDRGAPATFGVGQVIPGWVEALQLMTVGSKWKIYIPPQLAYGERGAPPRIPPNAALVFEVELLGIGGGSGGESR